MFTESTGRSRNVLIVVPLLVLGLGPAATAATPKDRILQPINSADRTPLRGNVSPQMRSAADVGKSRGSIPMERIKVIFKPTAQQQRELDILLAEQQDPGSVLP